MPDSNQIERIELRHLRYFKAVGEELHFRKAAEQLFISQPGLSRQIKQLEEVLDVTLLKRNKRTMGLTKAGVHLLDEIAFVLNHLKQTYETVRLLDKGEEGEIRIGFVGSAMHETLPKILMALNKEFPKLHTNLEQLGNKEQLDAIAHDRLDIGFIRSMQTPPGFERQEVHRDHFAIVVPKNHPLDASGFQNVSQLREENFILFSQDYSYDYYELVMSIFNDHGFSPKVLHRSVHPSTIFRLVENHMGVAIVPSVLRHGFNLDVRFLELTAIPQRTIMSAVWRKENRNPALRNFLDVLKVAVD